MDVSENRGGPPKSSILIGFSIFNHPFWGTPIFGNTHVAAIKLHHGCLQLLLASPLHQQQCQGCHTHGAPHVAPSLFQQANINWINKQTLGTKRSQYLFCFKQHLCWILLINIVANSGGRCGGPSDGKDRWLLPFRMAAELVISTGTKSL